MSAWKRVAIDYLPNHKKLIENAESPMQLWGELCDIFDDAYEKDEKEIIKKIYKYADWCIEKGGREGKYLSDAGSAAVVAFYEHIPTNLKARNEMHLFISRSDFLSMQKVFSYLLDEREFEEFKKAFLEKKYKMKP